MKILRRHETVNSPTRTAKSRAPKGLVDSFAKPMGALFLGGVMVFARPPEAAADGPAIITPDGRHVASAPLDVESFKDRIAAARDARPQLASEIDRLEKSARFERLPADLQSRVLDRHAGADRQTRSYLRGLVSSGTFAALPADRQDDLVLVAASSHPNVRAAYRALIVSADYQADSTEARVPRLLELADLSETMIALEGAVAESGDKDLRKHADVLTADPEFRRLPADVRTETVDQLVATKGDNRAWVVGLATSPTFLAVKADVRVALLQTLGEDTSQFRARYRAAIADPSYRASSSPVRAERLEAVLDAHQAEMAARRAIREKVDAIVEAHPEGSAAVALAAFDRAGQLFELPAEVRTKLVDAVVAGPGDDGVAAALVHMQRSPLALSMMPGDSASAQMSAYLTLSESVPGTAGQRAAKIDRLLGLVPGESRAQQTKSMQTLWSALEGSTLDEKVATLHRLVPMLDASQVDGVEALRAMQSQYDTVWSLAGGKKHPLPKALDAILDIIPDGLDADDVADLRSVANPASRLIGPAPVKVERIENHLVPTANGPLPVRVYRPAGPPGPRPVVQFNHGGAFVFGDIEGYDAICRRIAATSGCTVVIPEYRMAPDHPFPAPLDDALACYAWVVENAAKLDIDTSRIALVGDSAGGNLSAAMTHRLRGGDLPEPKHQILVYPWLDLGGEMPSRIELGARNLIQRHAILDAEKIYAPKRSDRQSVDVSPLRAKRFDALPSAMVMVGGHDPLRDEGRAYADALAISGVPVEVADVPSMTHGFLSMGDVLDLEEDPFARIAGSLRSAFDIKGQAPRAVVDHQRIAQVDAVLYDQIVQAVTKDWTPGERQALDRIVTVLDELAGADQRINYGDKSAIIGSLLRDTAGLVGAAHQGIDMQVHRPMVNGIAHAAVNRAFVGTRRPFASRRRAKIRGRIYGEARSMASKMLDDVLRQLHVSPQTGAHPDPDRSRNLTIRQLQQVQSDIALLQRKFGGNAEEMASIGEALKDVLSGTGLFDRPVFADGVPTPRRLSLFVLALDHAMGGK